LDPVHGPIFGRIAIDAFPVEFPFKGRQVIGGRQKQVNIAGIQLKKPRRRRYQRLAHFLASSSRFGPT
jgi:hypothetical protein